jgi:hypothetical protein
VDAECLNLALEAAESTGERIVAADAHTIFGELEERHANGVAADGHFQLALEILDVLAMPDRLRDCHMAYAKLLDTRGDLPRAAAHWRAAAEIGRLGASGLYSSTSAGRVELRHPPDVS